MRRHLQPTATHYQMRAITDLEVGYKIDNAWSVAIGANNLFDKAPPLAQLNLGFDPMVHDPRGRVIYIGLNQKF